MRRSLLVEEHWTSLHCLWHSGLTLVTDDIADDNRLVKCFHGQELQGRGALNAV